MLHRLILAAALLVAAPLAHAQEPLFAPAPLAEDPAPPVGKLIVDEAAARSALETGFPSVAAALYEQLLAAAPSESAARRMVLALVAARLDEGRVNLARQALGRFPGQPDSAYHLRAGLIAAWRGRPADAQAELAAIRMEELPAGERGWVYYLQGMLAESARDYSRADSFYQQAEGAAASDWQRARFILCRERARLALGSASETQAGLLRQNADRYQGRALGYDYARQYAVALVQLGRKEEAMAYLERQLASLSANQRAVRDDFRLLVGVVAGAGDVVGRDALEGLLDDGLDRNRQRIALQMLMGTIGADGVRERFRQKLDALIRAEPAHPILEDLLLARSELSLANQNLAQAEADAKALLARFPGSQLKPAALTQLASVAWEMRRYRTAADYASQASEATADETVRAPLALLVAEAYFRAKDFLNAADAYDSALESVPAGVPVGTVMFQRVMADIEGGRLDEAGEVLDKLAADARFDALSRWQAEWNLARARQSAGLTGEALQRMQRIRGEESFGGLPADLRARIAWLEARLAFEAGRPQDALNLIAALPVMMDGVTEALRVEIGGLSRLLEAEARFALGEVDAAIAVLKELRETSPDSDAKMRSYIVEADYYASVGRLVDAQALLTALADEHRRNPYAPIALFRAALSAEQRGQDEYYQQAYRLLERLVKDYKDSDLVFHARMKQGDLLRRLNQFGPAQQVYESLVNTMGQHPDVLAAQLALASCHRAQAATDASHFGSALTIFERLRDLTGAPVDLRVEAGFQLGDMYAQRGEGDRARAVWWPLVEAFLLDRKQATALGVKGRYWMARLLARQAELLEQEDRHEEAINAYQLIIDHGLPGAALARARVGGSG